MSEAELLASQDPFDLFTKWFKEVQNNKTLREPTAMTLATASAKGQPSARTVLLKSFSSHEGFVFYSNYLSHKGQDLDQNPKAALLFYWDPLFQQVRAEGRVEKISRAESEKYWNSRPFASKLAGWLSQQSSPVTGSLQVAYAKAEKEWQGREIPCPAHWGGYALKPEAMEFWIGQQHRLHISVRFERQGDNWRKQQIYP